MDDLGAWFHGRGHNGNNTGESGAVFPPVVLIVGKKMKVKDLLGDIQRDKLRSNSFGFGGASVMQPMLRSGVGTKARLSLVDNDDGGGEGGSEEGASAGAGSQLTTATGAPSGVGGGGRGAGGADSVRRRQGCPFTHTTRVRS